MKNTIKKTVCLVLVVFITSCVAFAFGISFRPIEDFDSIHPVAYIGQQLVVIRKYVYEAYWSGDYQKMENALYAATNDCEYLYKIAFNYLNEE